MFLANIQKSSYQDLKEDIPSRSWKKYISALPTWQSQRLSHTTYDFNHELMIDSLQQTETYKLLMMVVSKMQNNVL